MTDAKWLIERKAELRQAGEGGGGEILSKDQGGKMSRRSTVDILDIAFPTCFAQLMIFPFFLGNLQTFLSRENNLSLR